MIIFTLIVFSLVGLFTASILIRKPPKQLNAPVKQQGLPELNKFDELINVVRLSRSKDSLFDQRFVLDELESVLKDVRDNTDTTNNQNFKWFYIETTIKLLETYLSYDRSIVNREFVQNTKDEIVQVLPMVLNYFKHYQDKNDTDEYLDITTDIDVLKAIDKNIQNEFR